MKYFAETLLILGILAFIGWLMVTFSPWWALLLLGVKISTYEWFVSEPNKEKE